MLVHSYSADTTGFGRVNIDSMPDQTLMELLVADIENNTALYDCDGFLDIQSWEGLSFDDDENLKKIDFSAAFGFGGLGGGLFGDDSDEDEEEDTFIIGPNGSIDFKWIPKSVTDFEIFWLKLKGTIETSELSEDLNHFDVSSNLLAGTFCIASLPQNIHHVSISSNHLCGTLQIEKLPPKMTFFSAESNKFHGTLNLKNLPQNMHSLRLGVNDFSGSVDMSNLPSTMQFCSLHRTGIKQEALVIQVPDLGVKYFRLPFWNFKNIVDTEGNDLKDDFITNSTRRGHSS